MTASPEPGDRARRRGDAANGAAGEAPPADLTQRVLQRCEGDLELLERRSRRRTRCAIAGLAGVALFTLGLHVALVSKPMPDDAFDARSAKGLMASAGASGHASAAPAAKDSAATREAERAAGRASASPAAADRADRARDRGDRATDRDAGATARATAFARPGASAGIAVQLAPGAQPVPDGAAHWLANALRSDGRFLGGGAEVPRSDEVGLHAFALLALASAGPSPATQRETTDAALRAARWLLEQQEDDGSIGAPVGAGFDHALGTVALLEAGALTGDSAVRAAAGRAVALIAERQAPDGGWQPHAPGLPGSSPAQTAWTLAALLRAQQLGTPDLEHAIARGQSRLAADLSSTRAGGAHSAAARDAGSRDGGSRDGGSRDGRAQEPAIAAADLDLAAVRAVALGESRSRAPSPAGGLYAASLAVLAAPAFPR